MAWHWPEENLQPTKQTTQQRNSSPQRHTGLCPPSGANDCSLPLGLLLRSLLARCRNAAAVPGNLHFSFPPIFPSHQTPDPRPQTQKTPDARPKTQDPQDPAKLPPYLTRPVPLARPCRPLLTNRSIFEAVRTLADSLMLIMKWWH